MTDQPHAPDAGQALDTLVHQFADPLSFLRELVQNSVDAGTPEVEIRFEYRETADGGPGAMVIHVDDFGEGMDRAIIDTKLTRLFSSTKEGDLTKIGRFGIGFVSVFAIQPDAVCLDTSRGGDNWRVLFQKDRSFLRIARDEPVDGTKIQIVKETPRDEYEATRTRARATVAYWCRHLPTPVRFDGETLNQPLDIDVPCKVRLTEEGTEVVAGYTADGSSSAGYYNRGLTLLEELPGAFPGVAFKISSRWLEHTLTRDNVIRDGNFDKVLRLVQRLVESALPARLLERLEQEVAHQAGGPHAELLCHLVERNRTAVANAPDVGDRKLFRTMEGRLVTVAEVRRAAARKALYRGRTGSPTAEALDRDGKLVLDVGTSSAANGALAALVDREVPGADATFYRPLPVEPERPLPGGAPLCESLQRLLREHKSRLSGVALGRFDTPGSHIAKALAITQRSLDELTPADEAGKLGASIFSRRRWLVLNADADVVRRVAGLALREPELAAYLTAKLFFLGATLTAAVDSRLATSAVEARCRRQTS